VLSLKAVNCQSADTLAQEQVTAPSKEKVLDALGEVAAKLRGKLGESLATVQKFDVPLADDTTPSLEALKEWSLGRKVFREKGPPKALPYLERAVQLDPHFAMVYVEMGAVYSSLGELERSGQYYTKAFRLSEHVSEREKLTIAAHYYGYVTGELNKAAQVYEEEIANYPRLAATYGNLSIVYDELGQSERAAEMIRQDLLLAPDNVAPYALMAAYDEELQHFDEARQIIQEAQARKLDVYLMHNTLYTLAFLSSDSTAMAEQQQWYVGKPEEYMGLSLASDTEAYAGHLSKARELTKQSVGSAIRNDSKENGAIWWENAALREAAFGNTTEALKAATEGSKLASASQGVGVEVALALAIAGDIERAEGLARDLNKRYPLDTQMQSLWLPAIQAQLALDRKTPALALNALQAASRIELGSIGSSPKRPASIMSTYVERPTWLVHKAAQPPPSSRRFSTIAASWETAGREHWRVWAWRVPMRCSREPRREQMLMPPASVRSPPTKTSSPFGKTPTPRHPRPEASQSRVREIAVSRSGQQ